MGCVNCSSYVKLPKSKATLYFLSEFSELSLKTDNFFRSIEKDTQLDSEVSTFHTDNVFEFFLDNVEAFFTYFRIIDMKTLKIYGYEALVRGVHPDGSLMLPDQLF